MASEPAGSNAAGREEQDSHSELHFTAAVSDLTRDDLKLGRYSEIYIVNNVMWKVFVLIRDGKLGIFLVWHTDEKDVLRKVYCEFGFQVSGADGQVSAEKSSFHEFTVKQNEYGFEPFLSCDELMNPKNKYVSNGQFEILCYVSCGSIEYILPQTVEVPAIPIPKSSSMSDRAKYLLDSGICCDCEFLVSDGEKICSKQASKFVLCNASPVFESMFNGPLKHDKTVEVTDINADTFCILLYYIHGATWQFESQEQAISVYYAAKKYLLTDLEILCINYIWPRGEDTVWLAYEFAVRYEIRDMEKAALDFIIENKGSVFEERSFCNLSQKSLLVLLQRNQLAVPELDLFEAVLNWAKYQCKNQDIDTCGSNLRSVIGEVLRHIRFLCLTSEQFAQSPCESGILTNEEMVAVFRRIEGLEIPFTYLSCLREDRDA